MSPKWFICFVAIAFFQCVGFASTQDAPAKIRILIVDGQNNHNWRLTTPALKNILEDSGRFIVDVKTSPPEGAPDTAWVGFDPSFDQYGAVLVNYAGTPWPKAALDHLDRYLAAGGGLVAYHAAVAAFEQSPAWNKMIGLGWRKAGFGFALAYDSNNQSIRLDPGKGDDAGHGERVPFAVRNRAPDHPIMRGFPTNFSHAADELYHSLRGPAENVEILATGYSPITKLNEPLVWTVGYGRGRTFVTVLGHDLVAVQSPDFQTLLARGCEWAATGAVTIPIGAGVVAAQPSHEVILANINHEVRMHGPFAAVKLPITSGVAIHNPTAVAVGPDGHMYVANYTGEILRLDDTDGDGLEDTATLWADVTKDGSEYPYSDAKNYPEVPQKPGLRYPTAMLFKGNDLYVATTQEIRIYTDSHHVGHADTSRTFATGWPFTMHYFDWTFGLRFGPDGYLYTILCTDYLNNHPAPDPLGLRGSMLRISPDGKKFERYAYGLRFAYGIAFNEAGDLFCSDNEGGGNPTEKINHIVKGGNYGHHPKLADSPPIPPLLAITPHLSTDGIDFNPSWNNFGGTGGDLFIASWGPDGQWSSGGVLRARLKKQPDGSYNGNWSYFAEGLGKTVDVRFGPQGDLYAARFGMEGYGHTTYKTPGRQGDIYRIIYAPWLPPDEYTPDRTGVAQENPLLTPRLMGDPAKGKIWATQRTCLNCHSIDGSGNSLGPDLTHIWPAFGRDGVLEAIRQPSKTIASGYDGYHVTTTDGADYLGRLLSSDEEKIALRLVDKQVEVPRDRIKTMKMIKLSLMPEGLLAGMSDADVNDLLAFLQTLPPKKERVVRMRLGGPSLDAGGVSWDADQSYTAGGYGPVGGTNFSSQDPSIDPIVRYGRYGKLSYKADVDDGKYDVTLTMGEPYFHEPAKRVFSVSIQGETVLKDIDLVRDAGFGKALRKTFLVTVTGGRLEIGFSSAADPVLSAVEIRKVDSAPASPNTQESQPSLEPLASNDLSAWTEPTHAWSIVGGVSLSPTDDKILVSTPGTGILFNHGRTPDILSKQQFGDVQVHVEFMISKRSNSGVYFMGSYELQIYDSFGVEHDKYPGIECGGIYPRWVDNANVEGHSPTVNASLPPGQWQTFDATFRAPRFNARGEKIANAMFVKVVHNGKVVQENIELKGETRGGFPEKPQGPLRLQGDHGPVAFRNIIIQPLQDNR